MIWKPKEKDLTLEEAVEMARKELAPFWFGKSPQIAGVYANGNYSVFPLNPDFSKDPWLILIIDPTQYSGEGAILYAKEWHKRYSELGLNFLLLVTATYKYLMKVELAQKFVEDLQADLTVAIDVEQALAPAFGVKIPPKIILIHQNKKYLEFNEGDWVEQTEILIQKFLRIKEPGLPLSAIYQTKQKMVFDVLRVEFGTKPKLGTSFQFPEGIFREVPDSPGIQKGNFETSRVPGDILHEEELFVTGKWTRDAEKLSTSDPNATITFYATGGMVAMVAESLSTSSDHPIVIVEAGGLPLFESMAGQDITMDETGKSVVWVRKPGLYHLVNNATIKHRTITLRFGNVDVAPIGIFGLRIGQW
ncbi:MAG: hypothetical protein HYX41_07525 [Bdellovibrio sp.]|nr:hypothetical protein [Bdellovibrio sp.]